MLILNRIGAGDIPTQVPLYHISIWVQIQDLPLGFMSQVVAQHLGNHIGEFLEYDPKNDQGLWRTYMRIKVRVDVRVPLEKEKKVRKLGGEWRIVKFKYERLGVFCFLCGLLGHVDQYCEKLFTLENDSGDRAWGPELRVD